MLTKCVLHPASKAEHRSFPPTPTPVTLACSSSFPYRSRTVPMRNPTHICLDTVYDITQQVQCPPHVVHILQLFHPRVHHIPCPPSHDLLAKAERILAKFFFSFSGRQRSNYTLHSHEHTLFPVHSFYISSYQGTFHPQQQCSSNPTDTNP
jgi:hypothetical protein